MTDTTELDPLAGIENDNRLTPRQAAFCREYLVDLNSTQAAIRAGYSEQSAGNTGYDLINKPHIRKYIQEWADQRAERAKVNGDYVLSVIRETVERCRQVAPVLDKKGRQVYVATADGEEVPAFTFDAKNALKGAELLGKHLKIFTDVQEHKHSFTQMPTVEIARPDLPGSPTVKLTFDIGSEPEMPKIEG